MALELENVVQRYEFNIIDFERNIASAQQIMAELQRDAQRMAGRTGCAVCAFWEWVAECELTEAADGASAFLLACITRANLRTQAASEGVGVGRLRSSTSAACHSRKRL